MSRSRSTKSWLAVIAKTPFGDARPEGRTRYGDDDVYATRTCAAPALSRTAAHTNSPAACNQGEHTQKLCTIDEYIL